jgi:AraC-like DNA-binding protein
MSERLKRHRASRSTRAWTTDKGAGEPGGVHPRDGPECDHIREAIQTSRSVTPGPSTVDPERRQGPITEITFLLSFSDTSNFTRAFKRWEGVSPTQFRSSTSPA